jgi:4-diphosphocytidyl-2-C-methyl-D-erythritol kinase
MNAFQNSTPVITRQAPAKLNLSLRVTRRRDDGFHEIETLMVPVPGLHDVLSISPAEHFEFTCSDASLPLDGGNLVVRAAMAFAEATGDTHGVRLHLQKHIPSGAGLGGGSSDAAATLLALQEIHGKPLADEQVREIAASLGSDVPFFLQSSPALCTGRGEKVEPITDSCETRLRVLLLKPRFPVATVDAYRHVLDASIPPVPGLPTQPQEIDGLLLFNDLERPVFAKHRFLAELKLWLLHRPEVRAAMMSGSGSTLFSILHPSADADAIIRAAHHELDPTLWAWAGEIPIPSC